ncbi:uroporphyrinogen-III synthase [Piscinibacter koreensis]|uniref:Uroporphyrinogen-III synthase n=1 Tax=Piscinibacter koreensis TaxID=2742824 RepID=A0A7Y6NMK5_9BURK|nr:uroporphyrinogen-III synthase [Schlegelella koreensis]
MSAPPRVIVTRPEPQATRWVESLARHGVDAVGLPLIAIGDAPDAAAIESAWRSLPGRRLVMFVSPTAVDRFFAARPTDVTWPAVTSAASPGPGTSRVLLACGVPAEAIVEPPADAAQFDSEALWPLLASLDWRDAGVLIVRGERGRDWLASRLGDAGARVDGIVAYRRLAPTFDPAQQHTLAAAVAAPAHHAWLFSSSESIDNLVGCAPEAAGAAATAIATHPRIAARARAANFGRVVETRPTLADVVACIQSLSRD